MARLGRITFQHNPFGACLHRTKYLSIAISSHPHTKLMVIPIFMMVAFHNLASLLTYYLPFQVSLDSKNPATFQNLSFLLLIILNIPGRTKGKTLKSSRYPCVSLRLAFSNRWMLWKIRGLRWRVIL